MAVDHVRAGAIPFAFPGMPHIRCVFTTRRTGNISMRLPGMDEAGKEATAAARRELASLIAMPQWTEVRQVHGDVFLLDPEPSPLDGEPALEADGMATSRADHALCVKTADCQPILLAHPSGKVAAVHAGWRGNVLQFPESAVARFCSAYSLDPAEIRAVRGPSLGFAEFVNFGREWPVAFSPWFDRKTKRMDLWSLTSRQLCQAGLKPGNIYSLDQCTYSLPDLFFSHRRGDVGRQAAIIWRDSSVPFTA